MDRLSAYAQRESESETPEQRKKTEEEAIAKLLEQMKIAKEQKQTAPEPSTQQNGDSSEETPAGTDEASVTSSTTAVAPAESEAETDGESKKSRGIPENVKLFEIFHEQVASLVKMQRLTIQDTIALLVSLANLALYVVYGGSTATTNLLILIETSTPIDLTTLIKC